MRRSPQSKGVIRSDLNALEMLHMKRDGHSVEDIAKHYGIHRGTVWNKIKVELEAIRKERHEIAEEIVQQEIMRLDLMHNRLEERAARGDPQAIAVQLQIQARRAKLIGLDAKDDASTSADVLSTVTIKRDVTTSTTAARVPMRPPEHGPDPALAGEVDPADPQSAG